MRALILLWALSACVLHSNAPLFGEDQAVLLLGAQPVTLAVTGTARWLPAHLDLVPEGRHYRVVAPGPKAPTDLTLIPVGDAYVLQYGVNAGQDYAIARWDGAQLAVTPLDCARLKTDLRTNAVVQFANNACTLRQGDALTYFRVLADNAAAPTLVMRAHQLCDAICV